MKEVGGKRGERVGLDLTLRSGGTEAGLRSNIWATVWDRSEAFEAIGE